jgi:pimeloyl-ACP methyl ester carboxylesterase
MSEDSNRRLLPVGLDEGAGRRLVLIPGYAMRPDMYRRTARLLAERCRVILIDTYATRGRWRYEDVLESFTATLDNLGLERASFLGHSFGSGIELGFAVCHPQRVVELVFCDTLAVSSEWALAEEALSRPVRLLGMATPKAAIDFIRSWVTHPRQLVDAAWWGFMSVPHAYQASIARFFANNSSTGSGPAVTADVIYRAVIDPDPTAVRCYSAPDSAPIPRGKRILGADGYWQEFRNAVLGHPSDLWTTLMEAPGTTPVEIEV